MPLTSFDYQLTQLIFNLQALKSASLVTSMSEIETGLLTLYLSLALLDVMQRPLLLWTICQNWCQNPYIFLIAQGTKANTLDLFVTKNPDIYSNPTVGSPLANSDHCLIILKHTFVSHQKLSFTIAKLNGTLFKPISLHIPPSSFATLITNGILLGMDIFIPISHKIGRRHSPKWFNSQCPRLTTLKPSLQRMETPPNSIC